MEKSCFTTKIPTDEPMHSQRQNFTHNSGDVSNGHLVEQWVPLLFLSTTAQFPLLLDPPRKFTEKLYDSNMTHSAYITRQKFIITHLPKKDHVRLFAWPQSSIQLRKDTDLLARSSVFLFFLILFEGIEIQSKESEDYYKLLGVTRDATVKEIRKAFKLLAVKLHPDKNKDDKDADENFIKFVKAYEVLKDPNTRKHYDLHGDTPESIKNKQQYHSYSYYKEQFGIYDDDPIIVTLSRKLNVLDDNQAWFVNFYSPNCHHCHELAPIWRKLARELEGVIRIGAVNCEDDYPLCYQLQIEAYPTLLYYEKEVLNKSHLFEGQRYIGDRSVEALQEFVLSKIKVSINQISAPEWKNDKFKQHNRLLFLCCDNHVNCPEEDTKIKLSASLEGLVPTGDVKDTDLCEQISVDYKEKPVVFWQVEKGGIDIHSIAGADTKEILESILNKLPNPEILDEEKFRDIRSRLRAKDEKPWLICFYMGTATDLNLELKRLIHCGKSAALCGSLHVARYPTWVGGAFELHHGRDILHEVAAFARDSARSTNLHALSPADFYNVVNEGTPWLVDWYAPWCPPCKKLLPELRKASHEFKPKDVQFGTVDCTLHRNLCTKEGITSYPTIMLYNNTQIHRFTGIPGASSIVEFVHDMINPVVLPLDEDTFMQVVRKPKEELWAIDFFAPWCGPCQKLAPRMEKIRKTGFSIVVTQFPEVKIAQVDCVAHSALCDAQNIRSYPTIRLYPLGSKGLSTVAMYNGNRDAISLKRWLMSFLPSPVEALNAKQFKNQILSKNFYRPWLVDFYAPWCSHCVHFEPEFRSVAQKLEGQVRSAKIDCEAERVFCGERRVRGYPTVRLYLSPVDFYVIDSQDSFEIVRRVKELIKDYRHRQGHDEL
ncbi:hypothetical protein NQ318_003091 [Aromia moschata]|uniref:DnaJ homolog subfamily C member 10 n=1 Tax=Aromia moschata TaxID=1265417 RepID=A0AAV8XUB8_9CUCU|nr:hypothetical protein NQ318_003091 [Aromia moschata]